MMKNKFLIFSLTLFFALFIFLIYPQSSLAADLEVKTGTPGAGLTAANATGTVLNVGDLGGDITAGGAGFVYGTASADNGDYNIGTSSDFSTSYATGTEIALTLSSLSKGTLYYIRAYATSNDASSNQQNAYGEETTFLTGVDAPSSLSSESLEDRIKISWTAGAGAQKTVVRYNDGTTNPTATSSGEGGAVVSETEVTFYNLPAEHTYYFSLWSSTTDSANQGHSTTSDSYATVQAATTAVSAGGVSRTAPTTYSDSLIISSGAATTNAREVTLSLKAGNASLMTICNRSDLLNCPLENYAAAKAWTLTEGEGTKTVYAKFVSADGLNSDLVSDSIILAAAVEEPVEEAPAEEAVEEEVPVVEEIAEEVPAEEVVEEKPVSEMTAEELQVKIAEILAQVQNLQNQLAQLEEAEGIEDVPVDFTFENVLRQGDSSVEVKYLQIVLNSDTATQLAASGVGSPGNETEYFGLLTKSAVVKFQENYQEEVLGPWNLTSGTGFVGSTTRAKLNELLGK